MALAPPQGSGGGSVTLGAVTTVLGTGTTTDNAIARYDGVSGAMQDSGATIGDTGILKTLALQQGGANGQICSFEQLTEAHTLAAAATSDTTIQIPAGSLVVGVDIRVTTLITGCLTLDVGVAGATTRYGTGIALGPTTTNASAGTTNPTVYASAISIRFTAVGGGASFTAGVVRVTIHYIKTTAATS